MTGKIPYEVEVNAEKLWNYLNVRTPISQADAIVVLCSHDIRIAEFAAELYQKAVAPVLVFSGGSSAFTSKLFDTSEAEAFKQRAIMCCVPPDAILLEDKASNTQENIEFTWKMFRSQNFFPEKVILVQKPNMLRRVLATAKKLHPETKFEITSHEISFADAIHEKLTQHQLIHELVGDVQRLIEYPKRGWIAPQTIEPEVLAAYQNLKELGYTENLVPGSHDSFADDLNQI